ncbi:MAG: hypothetical protein LUE27_05780 [Clostridia bacterium]|nr:hypothetical protein [Clostridia bacterium]
MDSLELYIQVLRRCVDHKEASVAYIKQNYAIGYNKACRIMDWMAEQGYIELAKGKKNPSKVLLTMEQFNELYGDRNN